MKGIVGIGKDNSLVINSSEWNVKNEVNAVKDIGQLIEMSLVYNENFNKDSINLDDVMFIHHFADSSNVSKEALTEIKETVRSYIDGSSNTDNLLGAQNNEEYIERLKQGLLHLNQHLRDSGIDEIRLETDSMENPEVATNSVYLNKIISVNEKIANRMTFEYVAHVIHEDKTDSNKNGLNWQEKYVKNQIDSAVGMPIKYSPDFDGVPTDHGYFEEDIDGNIISYYSEIAGHVTEAKVDIIPGSDKRGLICTAYVDSIVHSDLANWLRSRFRDGKAINTSVEICGKKDENDNQLVIEYESTINKSPKIPKEFDYIGSAILGVEPADDYATFILINQKGEEEEIKLNLKEAIDKITELSADLKTATDKVIELEAVETNAANLQTELDTEIGKVKELTDEKAELQTFKDKAEEDVKINKLITEIDSTFDKDVVSTFSKEIEKLKENFGEFDTKELFINMYKESLKQTKETNEKLMKNSKEEKDDIFEVSSDSTNIDAAKKDFDVFVE